MREELNVCPFCGGEADWSNRSCNVASIHCTDCGAEVWTGECESYDLASAEAIKAWNTRPPEVTVRVDGGSSGASLPAHASPLRSAAATETQHSAGKDGAQS